MYTNIRVEVRFQSREDRPHLCMFSESTPAAVFTSACDRLLHGTADEKIASEGLLLQYRKSDGAILMAQELVKNSPHGFVQFQAALTLRHAVVEQWTSLSQERRSQIQFGLANMMPTVSPAVAKQLLQVLALTWKLGWLIMNEAQVGQVLKDVESLVAQGAGLWLVKAMVEEFSSSRATQVGQSFAFHRECHSSFEVRGLRECFCMVLDVLNSDLPEEKARAALDALEVICCWQFTNEKGKMGVFEVDLKLGRTDNGGMLSETSFRPGATWRNIVLGQNVFKRLMGCYLHWRHSRFDIAHQCRQLLVILSGLNGSIFENDFARAEFLMQVLSSVLSDVLGNPLIPMHVAAGLTQTFEANDRIAAGAQEYLDCSALLSRLFSNVGFKAETLGNIPQLPQVLGAVQSFSKSLLEGATACTTRVVTSNEEDEDIDSSWLMQAFDHMLEMWVRLCAHSRNTHPAAIAVFAASQPHLIELYMFYVEKRLMMARASIDREDHDDFIEAETFEDPTSLDEHLLAISLLGRAGMDQSIDTMLNVFQAVQLRLRQMLSSAAQESEWCKLSEELFWVVLLTSYLLADSGEGERPMIPSAVLASSAAYCASHNNQLTWETAKADPCVKLSSCLLAMLQMQSCMSEASLLLSEKILQAVNRWSMSYLWPELALYSNSCQMSSRLPASLEMYYGGGSDLLDFLVKCTTIFIGSSEPEVNAQAIQLLSSIVENPGARQQLQTLETWQNFINEAVSSLRSTQWTPLGTLTSDAHGSLLHILLKSLFVSNAEHVNQFRLVVEPLSHRLNMLAERLERNPPQEISNASWNLDVHRTQALYLGISNAAENGGLLAQWCREFLLEAFNNAWPSLAVRCLTILFESNSAKSTSFDNSKECISSILNLLAVFVDQQLEITPESQLPQVLRACVRMMEVYIKYHELLQSTERSSIVENDMWAQDIVHLMKILSAVANRDLLDFSEASTENSTNTGESVDAIQVVLQGTQFIFPMVSEKLLQYPGLAEQFFTLLSTLIIAYPDRICDNTCTIFAPMVQALEFGISDHRMNVSRKSLEALFSLSIFHADQLASTKPGIHTSLLYPNGGPDSVLLNLLQQVLSFLAFQTFDSALLNPAANAVMALIACELDNFPRLVNSIILSQTEPNVQEKLVAAFNKLVTVNQVQFQLEALHSRLNRKRFQENMLGFVNDIRGFVRKK